MVLQESTAATGAYLPFVVGAATGLIVLAFFWYRRFTQAVPEGHGEFEDLQLSLGAEAAEPDIVALKDAEIIALKERLLDLEDLGHRIGHIEKRHLAERERLEQELLEASLEAEEKKSYERRWKAIRTRYRNLKERIDELPEDLDEAEGELDSTKKELDRSEAKVEKQRKELERLKQRLARRDALLEKTKDRLQRALEDTEKQRERASLLRQEQVDLKRELRELRHENAAPRPVDLMRQPKADSSRSQPKKKASSRKKSS